MAKQNKSKKKKRPAPQAPAAKPAQTAPAPEQPLRTAKLMAALCYLNVLILIPACTKWRHDEFVKFHLNQGLVVLALATVCAERYGVPMVFAKKAKSDNIEGGLYQSEIFSYTYKKKATLIVAQEWLGPEDKVLIIDDFMANGYAMRGLIDIVNKAGAELAGIGVAVEKGFQRGGDSLREEGYNIHSLAIIDEANEHHIRFREGT